MQQQIRIVVYARIKWFKPIGLKNYHSHFLLPFANHPSDVLISESFHFQQVVDPLFNFSYFSLLLVLQLALLHFDFFGQQGFLLNFDLFLEDLFKEGLPFFEFPFVDGVVMF